MKLITAAVVIPSAFALQWLFWGYIAPHGLLLMYPAVVVAALLSSVEGGVLASILAAGLYWFFFLPPYLSFAPPDPNGLVSIIVLGLSGILCSIYKHYHRNGVAGRIAGSDVGRNEDQYRALFEHDADGVLVVAPDGNILSANRAARARFGYTANEFKLLDIDQLLDQTDPRVPGALAQWRRTGYQGELTLKNKVGRRFPAHISIRRITTRKGRRLGMLVVSDVAKPSDSAPRESTERLRSFIEHVPAAIAMFDGEMRYLAVSRRWIEDHHLPDRDVIGESHYDACPETDEKWKAIHRRGLAGEIVRGESDGRALADGCRQWLKWEVRPWFAEDGGIGGIIMFTEDITRHGHAEEPLHSVKQILDQASEAIAVSTPDGIIETVNTAFSDLTGYAADEAIGQSFALLKSGQHEDTLYRDMWRSLNESGHWQGEIYNRKKNGEIYSEWLTIDRVTDEAGKPLHYVAVFSDIDKLKESQRKIEFLATHDTLTGLPNRTLFNDRLRHAMAQMKRENDSLALMFIDLDNFKSINDTLGHDVGDAFLVRIADRLRQAVRDVDTVARLGGDEFTAIIPGCSPESASLVGARIAEDLSAPAVINGQTIYSSASIGIACYPEDGQDASGLLKAADTAMYRAKELGRNRVEFFVPELQIRLLKRATMEAALRRAIDRDRFHLVFQPKVDLTDNGSMVGAEALLRWQDDELGLVSPSDFIQVAEKSRLIVDLGYVTERLLLKHMADWSARGLDYPMISLNVSARSLREPDFARRFKDEVEAWGVPKDRIQVEITESALLEDREIVVRNLEYLALSDVRISVDDFGTGFSSLSYLKTLPLNELKIDKSFIAGLGLEPEDEAIAQAILAMAAALELTTVAEGVETELQRNWLRRQGCDIGQGYLFSKPLDAEAFVAYLGTRPH